MFCLIFYDIFHTPISEAVVHHNANQEKAVTGDDRFLL